MDARDMASGTRVAVNRPRRVPRGMGSRVTRMNASNSPDLALPKGPTRQRLKGRRDRAEAAVQKAVRAKCVERDGLCRINGGLGVAVPLGQSEHAHMHVARKSKTRNQAPEIRHSTKTSLMLCAVHHRLYDAKELTIDALTDQGADGPLTFSYRGKSYSE